VEAGDGRVVQTEEIVGYLTSRIAALGEATPGAW